MYSADPAGKGAQLKALAGPLVPYMVELLLATRVALDGEHLRRALADISGEIELGSIAGGGIALTHREHFVKIDGSEAPMVHLVSYSDDMGDASGREAALIQTWDWPEPSAPEGSAHAGARAAVTRSQAVLSIMDRPGLPYERRLALFQALVRALVIQLPVLAIHWTPSARIVDPQKYLVPNARDSVCQGPVNVRLFKVEGGAPATLIMDTLGLSAFGLRDLQVIFQEKDPNDVAAWLYEVARRVFEGAAKIKDGDTIDALGATWRCHRDGAAVAPTRYVIDFRPRAEVSSIEARPTGMKCPGCGWIADALARWECDCGFMWNTFETRARCPACSKQHLDTDCPRCDRSSPHARWYT